MFLSSLSTLCWMRAKYRRAFALLDLSFKVNELSRATCRIGNTILSSLSIVFNHRAIVLNPGIRDPGEIVVHVGQQE